MKNVIIWRGHFLFKKIFSGVLLLFLLVEISAQIPVCKPPLVTAGDAPPGCLLCKSESFRGSTGDFAPFIFGGSIAGPCGILNNNFFLTAVPNDTGDLKIKISLLSSNIGLGVQAGLFTESMVLAADCGYTNHPNFPSIIEAKNLDPNAKYFLMIDATGNDICEVKVELLEGGKAPKDPGATGDITFDSPNLSTPGLVCEEVTISFEVEPAPNANSYFWEVEPFTQVQTVGDNFAKIKFPNPGIKKVKVTPYNFCQPGTPSEIEIEVRRTPRGVFPTQTVCPENFPIELDGYTFPSAGRYIKPHPHPICDSLVSYSIIARPRVRVGLDTAFCKSKLPFVFNGNTYHSSGTHDFILPIDNPNLCDSIFTLDINVADEEPLKIECIPDTFINAVAIRWEELPFVDNYSVFINDEFVGKQSHTSFLHIPDSLGKDFKIAIHPENITSGCNFLSNELICELPDIVSTSSIEASDAVLIFPNPSTGMFEISSELAIQTIEILDFSGKVILPNSIFQKKKIDLSNEPAGVYFFKIKTEEGVFVKKAVKI